MNNSACVRFMAMPIEYLGYVPDCQDINTFNFEQADTSRYAAVFTWLQKDSFQRIPALSQWLNIIAFNIPMLFIQQLPTDNALLARLGIQIQGELKGKITLALGDNWLNSLYPLRFSPYENQSKINLNQSINTPLIAVQDQHKRTSTLFFKADWGGAIVNPLPMNILANKAEVWQIDPFRLINEILSLTVIPVADVTSESGRRILTSHVDGDGFPSKAWFPDKHYAAEVLLEHIYQKYTIPQSISVIEGEVSQHGLYPNESAKLETIAREIFKLPHVEIGSHTFSHPFSWKREKNKTPDNLPIPDYTFNYHDEIIGSIEYINNNLTPKHKKARLIFWSGRANPDEDIIAIAEKANLLNVNGGNTYVVNGDNHFTSISPTIVWYPSAVQVYAPIINEGIYTSLWTEQFDAYRRAVETFQLLGEPRRLKTIAIYYHTYSGAYPASLNALTSVYDWAIEQKTTPLFLSEYATRARTLYETGIAKTLAGKWQITSTGIKSIRLPNALGYPVTALSELPGWNAGPDGHYLILNKVRTRFALSATQPEQPRLSNANAQLTKWIKKGKTIQWAFNSHVPFQMEWTNIEKCSLHSHQTLQKTKILPRTYLYQSKSIGVFQGTLTCNHI